jgi:hypothetical protein
MTKADLDKVLAQYPTLGERGFVVQQREQSLDEAQAQLGDEHERLHQHLAALTQAEAWIRTYMRPTPRMNNRRSSASLQQLAAADIGAIPNGVFIAAAIHCGYQCKQLGFGPNAEFNMQERTIQARESELTSRMRRGRRPKAPPPPER